MKIKIIYILLSIFFCSCSDKRDFETYISYLGIDFSEPYKTDSIKQVGFTDWTLEAAIKVHDKDKIRILNKIKRQSVVEKVKSREFYFDSIHNHKDSLYSFIIGSKYYYGLNKPSVSGYEVYELNLDTLNNKLFFSYEYE